MSGKKTETARRKYDDEFKRDVLKMISGGRSVQDVSNSLGLNTGMVHRWRGEQNQADVTSKSLAEGHGPEVSRGDHELVKARLREVEQERDILKKALGIFSRGI
ncbi:transposase [Mucilaginibacter paludis]|uniref:Transposase IS3/IS911 family protein n=1 Tax=Mucilaginibacter paludis DSM 18603 TaxID=714943 RepID=H1Y0P6_9SPHI|nr:transposase [Mucilaginibacter paludis]EHQ28786.1 transposase IS3/IS911 family protein [Mucilaginibacter paludis DSM 18603]